MNAPTSVKIAAGVVATTATGVATNLATADGASRWMWLAVVAIMVVSVGVALWSGPGRDPTAQAPGHVPRDVTVNIYNGTFRNSAVGGDLHRHPPWNAWPVVGLVVALIAGAAAGLAAPDLRGTPAPGPTLPPPTATPGPTVPPSTVPATLAPTDPPTTSRTAVTPTTRRPTPVESTPVEPTPAESPVGTWLSLDRTFETLYLYPNGTYRWEDPPQDARAGRYRITGTRITLSDDDETFSWTVSDALLTLTDGAGGRHRYTRN